MHDRTPWASGLLGLALLVGGTACLSDNESPVPPSQADAGAVAGGTTGPDASGCPSPTGDSGVPITTPVCQMPAKWRGVISKSTPLISVGRPVTSNSTEQANKGLVVDGKYHVGNGLLMTPVAGAPVWAAIDVGIGPSKLLLGWQDTGFVDYGPSYYAATDNKLATSPLGYVIKTSPDSTNGVDGTWTTAVTVTDNPVRSRTHGVAFAGMRWLRFEVTAAGVAASGAPRDVRIDEIELHDHSAIGEGDLADGWFLMGDSITKMTFNRAGGPNELDQLISAQRPAFTPALVEAGNGGETLTQAMVHLQKEEWLKYAEGLSFVTLAFGTNDSWGTSVPGAGFEKTLRTIITLLTDAKRVPILPRIPWNTVSANLAEYNAVIDKLQQEFQLPCGPDLFAVVAAHPEYVQGTPQFAANCTVTHSGDGVHPQSSAAKAAIQQAYADTLLPLYPSP